MTRLVAATTSSGASGIGSGARRAIRPAGGPICSGMRFGAAFWINRTTWPALRDAARRVEAAGFDSLWADDHLLADEGDWTDPSSRAG